MSGKGSIKKRCGCTEVVGGKRRQLGDNCPRLRRPDGAWNPRHGTWTFAISVKGTRGKRERVVRGGFESQRDAQAAMDELKGKAARGVDVASRLTVGQYLRQWIAGKRDIKLNTLTSYTGHIDRYWEPHLGHVRLADLRAHHVAEVFEAIEEHNELCRKGRATRPVGPTSVHRIRATLRVALGDAMREGLISANPAALVKLPKAKRPKGLVWTDDRVSRWQSQVDELVKGGMRLKKARAQIPTPSPVMVWRPDQLGQFLDHAHDDRLYALWHLYSFRGLRRGEACGLEWPEVDLMAGSIAIVRQRISIAGAIVEDTPKSDAGVRIIPLDQQTVSVLRAHRKQQMADRLAAGRNWMTSDKVFTAADGSPLDPNDVSDQFEDLTIAAGLPPIRLHDLRHGAASLMIAAGVAGAFRARGWREGRVDTRITSELRIYPYAPAGERDAKVELSEVFNEGYKVDNVKGRIALDVEWNAKDGNLDRDIGAYRSLYEVGRIDGAVLITRTQENLRQLAYRLAIEAGQSEKDARGRLGTTTTTNLTKLEPRMTRGDAGGCPLLAVAISSRCWSDT